VIRIWLIAALLLAPICAWAQKDFALLGDAPYSQPHANLLDGVIDEINTAAPAFVVHLGDITGGTGPCTDEWFEARVKQFARLKAPFVLVPGDNEWTDCHRTGFDPMERLAKIRQLFHSQPVPLTGFKRQSAEYPEHVRWTHDGAVFVGINVPGSNNNLGRTAEMDDEYAMRMKAVFAWLDEAVKLVRASKAQSLVVMMQANPLFEGRPRTAGTVDGYAELRDKLVAISRKLGKPLVVAHGDTHRFKHDRPVPRAPNLVRIEVDGWPWLGWLKVGVTADAARPVEVERLLSPAPK
jgi:hypothetical protein